ncbi:MAG: DUF2586 family protein [Crocinitomicaceae bacterium]|nr:DUF2586 family protein [Crocinitomicaceae bacterium]
MLPGINIEFQNGALGQVVPLPDGCFGVVTMADEVSTTFVHETPYIVKSMKDVADLGITDTVGNHILYKFLEEFFTEGGTGQELWIMAFPKLDVSTPVKMSDLFTSVSGEVPVAKLMNAANGKLRGLFALWNPDATYTPVITDGMDADVALTKTKAQAFLEDYTNTKKAPAFCVLEAYAFTGIKTALADLTYETNNRVAVLIGDTETRTGVTASKGTALGVLAGRLAKNSVQTNIGRVADGPVKQLSMYILDDKVEDYDVESLHDKGYITFRTHVGKSGYFFTDDPLATEVADDYHYLTMRRVIDKAFRIAYNTLLNFLLDDVQLTNQGTVSPIYAKTIEGQVINAIYSQMTANGELSADLTDTNDKAVVCVVDLTNNVAATSKLNVTVQVRPKGYARYIDVPLGFVPVNN